VYYLLEAEGFDCWLVNAREVKNVPGRAKTDRADAVWLAKVAERGMCRPSLVQPPEIRRLRDLTRYRRALVQDRTREQQRVEKLLEDAQIKVSAVLSNLHGVTGRAIMNALIAGERDPRTLAPDKGCGTDHGALAQAPVHRDLLHHRRRRRFTSACPPTARSSWVRGSRSRASRLLPGRAV
jgi:Transposase